MLVPRPAESDRRDRPEASPPGGPGEPGDPPRTLGGVRAVIEALPEAVLVAERDGRIELTNPAADRLFAGRPVRDRADLLSRFERIAPDGDPTVDPTPLPPEVDETPLTVRPRGDATRWFALRTVALEAEPADPQADGSASSPSHDGDVDRPTVFVLRDVTDGRELRPVREAFLAVLSHELRTPITTIYAGSSVLAKRPNLSPPATQTLARDISAEASRLYDLVEDLLVLARLERDVLDPLDEPVLVQRAVDATIRMASERFGSGLIERLGDVDAAPVRGDSTYVEQACRNLILTSIRYAGDEPDRRLAVEIRADEAAGEVGVAILDRGPAMDPAELPTAFDLPTASSMGRVGAAGVGPFVCRNLIAAMGGRTWARNRDGGGLEMGFALRMQPA